MTRSNDPKLIPDIPEGSRILLDQQIKELSAAGLIQPFVAGNRAPCSYDFTVGAKYMIAGSGGESPNTVERPLILESGCYAGVISAERVKLPPNVYVMLGTKRKLSYEGIVLLSGSIIDPGYEGHLLFVLYNSSGKRRPIRPGKKICVATFFQLDHHVPNPIGMDPALAGGNFPEEFIALMLNMELPSVAEIAEKLKEMASLQERMLKLEKTYTDVVEPINRLTANVEKVNEEVDKTNQQVNRLVEEGKKVFGKLDEHDKTFGDVRLALGEQGLHAKWASRIATIVLTAVISVAFSLGIGLAVWMLTHAGSGNATSPSTTTPSAAIPSVPPPPTSPPSNTTSPTAPTSAIAPPPVASPPSTPSSANPPATTTPLKIN
jgi:deoxycytidine triphosphate deaminase/uncharacterized coiled-coil protein SlyX